MRWPAPGRTAQRRRRRRLPSVRLPGPAQGAEGGAGNTKGQPPTPVRPPAIPASAGGARRGFADTLLSYPTRRYNPNGWNKVQDVLPLTLLAGLRDPRREEVFLDGLAGWDDDTFYLTASTDGSAALVFRCRRGEWSLAGKFETTSRAATRQRLLDRDTLLFATGRSLYELSGRGTIDRGLAPRDVDPREGELCPVAPELYFLLINDGSGAEVISKVSGGKRVELGESQKPEAFVHTDDALGKDSGVAAIKHTRAVAPGCVVGIHPGRWNEYQVARLVRYQEGTWKGGDKLPGRRVNDLWVQGEGGEPGFLVAVGPGGYVYAGPWSGAKYEVPPPTGAAGAELLRVWGVDAEQYSVLDRTGNVWERAGGRWGLIVRGPADVRFHGAWVSPSGRVIAVTQKAVYLLE